MKSILLADDEATISLALRRSLADFGFEVRIAQSVESALRMLRRHQFDAVLLEFNLRSSRKGHPRSGAGLQVVRRLRTLGDGTPVLIFTGMEGPLYEVASLDAGADGFLRKTDGISRLVERLRELLGQQENTEMKGPSRRLIERVAQSQTTLRSSKSRN